MADDPVHKSCCACSACMQKGKRSYKDFAFDKNVMATPTCRDVRDNYMKCKHEQVGLVVRERLFDNPESLRFV